MSTHECDGQDIDDMMSGRAKHPQFILQLLADYAEEKQEDNSWVGLRKLWHTSRHGSRQARQQREHPGLGYRGILSSKFENEGVFVKTSHVASGLLPHVRIASYMVRVRVLFPRCFAADSTDASPTVSELVEQVSLPTAVSLVQFLSHLLPQVGKAE